MLAAYTTAMDAAHGTSPSLTVQSTNVDRGEGTFTLFLPMLYRGWPHVSFYADGESFGEVYFGTGDSVLKQWWGSNEANDATPTEATETQQSDEDVRRVTIAISDRQTATAESQPGRLRLQIRDTGSSSEKFPSLEDQKQADLAFRRLGLELELIGEKDLKRVQALGYDGGVKVTQNSGWDGPDAIHAGDILVGLSVWPTTNLKQVADVLKRDDLAELEPLKFYAVRPGAARNQPGLLVQPEGDTVVTGRISVNADKRSPQRTMSTEPYSAGPPATAAATSWHEPGVGQPILYIPPRTVASAVPVQSVAPTYADPTPATASAAGGTAAHEREKSPITSASLDDSPNAKSWGTELGEPRLRALYLFSSSYLANQSLDTWVGVIEATYPTIQVERVNVISQRELAARLMRKYRLKQAPALLVFRDDKVVVQLEGNTSDSQLRDALTAVTEAISAQSVTNPLDASKSDVAQPNAAKPSAAPASDVKPTLRYDGKTFDEWRTAWKTELSTEKRLDAVKALAAFGANGYGKEAAETILRVVPQYDFSQYGRDTAEGKLESAIVVTIARKIPMRDWLPAVSKFCEFDPQKADLFILRLLNERPTQDKAVEVEWRNMLLKLAKDRPQEGPGIVLGELVRTDPTLEVPAIGGLFRQCLRGDDFHVNAAARSLNEMTVLPPELTKILLHGDQSKQQAARIGLEICSGKSADQLAAQMVSILKEGGGRDDHLAAIRTLAALRPQHGEVPEILDKIVESGNESLKVAAAFALERISRGSKQADDLLRLNFTYDAGKPQKDIQSLIDAEQLATFGRK